MSTQEVNATSKGLPMHPYYFKEIRLGIVSDDFSGPINYQTCPDDKFLEQAEKQGTVWSLQGAEKGMANGELFKYLLSIKHPNYAIIRYVDMYEYKGQVYCSDVHISNPDRELST
jgi:hypothetical protein